MSALAMKATLRRQRALPAIAGAVVALGALALLGRAALAHLAHAALAERGLECAPMSLGPAWDPWGVEVGSTSCTVSDTRITGVGLPYGATIELDRLRPRAVRVLEVTAELGGELDLAGVGGALLDGAVPAPMAAALSLLANAARRPDVPALDVAVARVRRREVTLVLHRISVSRDDDGALRITLGDLMLPVHHGRLVDLELRLDAIAVRATPSDVTLDADIVLDARIAAREIDRRVPIHVTGSGLDGEAPTFAMRLETTLDLAAIRARIEALAARRVAADEADGRSPLERVGEVADRLEAIRARMAERAGDPGPEGAATEGAAVPTGGGAPGTAPGPTLDPEPPAP